MSGSVEGWLPCFEGFGASPPNPKAIGCNRETINLVECAVCTRKFNPTSATKTCTRPHASVGPHCTLEN